MPPAEHEIEEFVCDRCARCCREHRVPLTRADVMRLLNFGKDVREFVEYLGPEDVDMTGEPESFVRLREGWRMLFLRHGPGHSGCVLLAASGCTVHAARPSACRTYPFDRPEREATLGLVPGHLCPPETGFLVTLRRDKTDPAHRHFVTTLEQRDAEMSDHALFVARWNRRQRLRTRLGRLPESRDAFVARLLRQSSHHA